MALSLGLSLILSTSASAQKVFDTAKKVKTVFDSGKAPVGLVTDANTTTNSLQSGQILDGTAGAISTTTSAADTAKLGGQALVKGATYLQEGGTAATNAAKYGNTILNNGALKAVGKAAPVAGMVTGAYTGAKKMNEAAEAGDQLGVVDGFVEGLPVAGQVYGAAKQYPAVYNAASEEADARAEANESVAAVERSNVKMEAAKARTGREKNAAQNSGVDAEEVNCPVSEETTKILDNVGTYPEPGTNFGTSCIKHGQSANAIYREQVKKSDGMVSSCQSGSEMLTQSAQLIKNLNASDSASATAQIDESIRVQNQAKQKFNECSKNAEKQIKALREMLYGKDKMSFDNIATKSIEYRRDILGQIQEEKAKNQASPQLANLENRYNKFMIDTRGLIRQVDDGKSSLKAGTSICADNAIYVQKLQNEIRRIKTACENQGRATEQLLTRGPEMRRPFEQTMSGGIASASPASGLSQAPALAASSPSAASSRAPSQSPSAQQQALDRLAADDASLNNTGSPGI